MALPPKEDTPFLTLQSSLKSSLLSATRTTTQLCAEDLSFHRSLDPSVARQLDEQNARLLDLARKLLANVQKGSDVVGSSTLKLADSEELEANWKGVVDVVDSLLEKADMELDEYTGLIRKGVDGAAGEVRLCSSRDTI
jgi:exosome complex exonuclease RRP6